MINDTYVRYEIWHSTPSLHPDCEESMRCGHLTATHTGTLKIKIRNEQEEQIGKVYDMIYDPDASTVCAQFWYCEKVFWDTQYYTDFYHKFLEDTCNERVVFP